MLDNFYRAFEERHRGSRELITQRLEVYLPFIKPLLTHYPEAHALDLGCGRGEWMELLISAGFVVRGVDLDDGMLSVSRKLGLDVQKNDVLDALKSVDDCSLTVVSAFHLVEHIEFDRLRELVAEAQRVLVPGGLLIMETPNPEHIIVAGCHFYLDPTHKRPIPPLLLSFVAEYAGFSQIKVVRLQESAVLHNPGYRVGLLDVLNGVSPDYAVVAQKSGGNEIIGCNVDAFQKEYGLSPGMLAARYAQPWYHSAAIRAKSKITRLLHSMSRHITAHAQALGYLSHKLLHRGHYRLRVKLLLKYAARFFTRTSNLEQLTPHARQIHADLKSALTRRRKEKI